MLKLKACYYNLLYHQFKIDLHIITVNFYQLPPRLFDFKIDFQDDFPKWLQTCFFKARLQTCY